MEREEKFKRESIAHYAKTTWAPVSFQEEDGRSNCGLMPYSQYQKMFSEGGTTKKNSVNKVNVTTLDGLNRRFLCECVIVIDNPVIASVMYFLLQSVSGPGNLVYLPRQSNICFSDARLIRSLYMEYCLLSPCRRHGGTCTEMETRY